MNQRTPLAVDGRSQLRGALSRPLPLLAACIALSIAIRPAASIAQPAPSSETRILHPADMGKLIPATVFFRGQTAAVQMRNSGGVELPDGMFAFSVLVDNSGYSTAIRQKYQGYFITEVPLDIHGHTLQAGAYGVGFIDGNQFVVMDLGAHVLFTAESKRDTEIKRPTPLQVLPDTAPDHYRLYYGRDYVVCSSAGE